jgi:hypothetical protein
MRGLLEGEPPTGDIRSKIAAWVRQMPDWLQCLCLTALSMNVIGLKPPPLSQDVSKLRHTKSDWRTWPFLPQGILEPRPDHGDQFRLSEMSLDESMTFLTIMEKPEEEWTRREHKFMREIWRRL